MMTLVAPLTFIASSTYATFSITLIGAPCLPERRRRKRQKLLGGRVPRWKKYKAEERDVACLLIILLEKNQVGFLHAHPVRECIAHEMI